MPPSSSSSSSSQIRSPVRTRSRSKLPTPTSSLNPLNPLITTREISGSPVVLPTLPSAPNLIPLKVMIPPSCPSSVPILEDHFDLVGEHENEANSAQVPYGNYLRNMFAKKRFKSPIAPGLGGQAPLYAEDLGLTVGMHVKDLFNLKNLRTEDGTTYCTSALRSAIRLARFYHPELGHTSKDTMQSLHLIDPIRETFPLESHSSVTPVIVERRPPTPVYSAGKIDTQDRQIYQHTSSSGLDPRGSVYVDSETTAAMGDRNPAIALTCDVTRSEGPDGEPVIYQVTSLLFELKKRALMSLWRECIAQAVLDLVGAYEICGTNMGVVACGTQFSRMVVLPQLPGAAYPVVALEVPESTARGSQKLSEWLSSSSKAPLRWDLQNESRRLDFDAAKILHSTMKAAIGILGGFRTDTPLSRIPDWSGALPEDAAFIPTSGNIDNNDNYDFEAKPRRASSSSSARAQSAATSEADSDARGNGEDRGHGRGRSKRARAVREESRCAAGTSTSGARRGGSATGGTQQQHSTADTRQAPSFAELRKARQMPYPDKVRSWTSAAAKPAKSSERSPSFSPSPVPGKECAPGDESESESDTGNREDESDLQGEDDDRSDPSEDDLEAWTSISSATGSVTAYPLVQHLDLDVVLVPSSYIDQLFSSRTTSSMANNAAAVRQASPAQVPSDTSSSSGPSTPSKSGVAPALQLATGRQTMAADQASHTRRLYHTMRS